MATWSKRRVETGTAGEKTLTTVDKKAQVQEFFGAHASAYTTSAVHAQGASLERLVVQVAPQGHERVLDGEAVGTRMVAS